MPTDLEASGVYESRNGYFSEVQLLLLSQPSATPSEVSQPPSTPDPFVFIASYWEPGSTARVRVFGNVEEVDSRLNGRSAGRRRPDADRISKHLRHPPFTFQLAEFKPGTLEAAGYVGGRVVAQHRVSTPEAVERLQLELDDAGVCPEVDARDLVFVRARLVDRNGTTVPRSGRVVNFNAGEGLALVGSPSATTEAGIASVLARVTGKPGWRVTATSDAVGTEAALHGNRRLQDQKDDRGPAAIADSGSRTRAPARVANRLRSKYHINTF